MTRDELACNSKLTKTQVRNPNLPVPNGKDSWIESVPWDRLEATGVSIVTGGIGAVGTVALFGILDIFLSVPHVLYTFAVPVFIAGFVFAMWCVRVAPSRNPPIELGTAVRKQAWVNYHALPIDQQTEVVNSFRHYLSVKNVTSADYRQAERHWNEAYLTLKKREELVTVVDNSNPVLEEAQHELANLKAQVKQLEG